MNVMNFIKRSGRLCAVVLLASCMVAPGSLARAATPNLSFTDSFNGAEDADPHYGLNDNLAARQISGVRGITYTRVPGLWYAGDKTGDPLRSWHSQVNHPAYPDTLSMFLRTSAVRLDAPVINDSNITVSSTLTPVVGTNQRNEWASLVLGSSASSRGYVSDTDSFGMLVSSHGKLQVFQYGKLVLNTQLTQIPQDGVYHVKWHVTNTSMDVTVNGQVLKAAVSKALPAKAWLFMGRYSDYTDLVTSFDDLSVSKVDATALQGGAVNTSSNLRYFGYFASRIESVDQNHLGDVNGFSNLNWVSVSDSDSNGYKTDELAKCKPSSCIVNAHWQFFIDCPGADCRLRDDAQEQWDQFAAALAPYADRIAAFALMDEAYYQGASAADVSTSADMVKASFPTKKVMMNLAAPSVSATVPIPKSVDWVAFDQYCAPMTTVENTLRTLETATSSRPDVQLFIYTEAARTLCGTTKSDAAIASLQWSYYNLALKHPRVAGILPFGMWTSEPTFSNIPLTVDAEQRIAARIVR